MRLLCNRPCKSTLKNVTLKVTICNHPQNLLRKSGKVPPGITLPLFAHLMGSKTGLAKACQAFQLALARQHSRFSSLQASGRLVQCTQKCLSIACLIQRPPSSHPQQLCRCLLTVPLLSRPQALQSVCAAAGPGPVGYHSTHDQDDKHVEEMPCFKAV